ncbi:protein-L-isoaspartate(D-aspartate) O-methyltransferase [Aeoliella sp.]|uniref:protein-L-isoaspartate(D-aspartate) O-methyltransferase n=1 Tax=Aeoliella sp. TaxID=2795800 RepID=UPI003CCC3543
MDLFEELSQLGITDDRVLDAMRRVPRERFVPQSLRKRAYENRPLPIGHEQTISQPLVVAEMIQHARPEPGQKVLDIGTGSGYQAAILAELYDRVYTVEIVEPLQVHARKVLDALCYTNIEYRLGDGSEGWPEHAPYNAIVVAAAPRTIPPALVDQLAPGGRLVIPVGTASRQHLTVVEKLPDESLREMLVAPVSFVPLVGGGNNT